MRVLVTGGVRSGKSRHAESLLSPESNVIYVAPGPTPDQDADPDWAWHSAAGDAASPLPRCAPHCLAMAMRRRSSGSMKWSWSSVPRSICTQWILPVKRLDRGE